jgi:hypothetical protein
MQHLKKKSLGLKGTNAFNANVSGKKQQNTPIPETMQDISASMESKEEWS